MSEFSMNNGVISAVISEHAAEMHSLKRLDSGIEYLWQGDPAFWAGRNPTLFPMVGSTWNKEVHLKGNVYHMGNHGFTRNSEFTCIEHDGSHIAMELCDSPETLAQYPYRFRLVNTYTIKDNTLTVNCRLENRNDETMPFNFGFHPAFNVPIGPNGDKQHTVIRFDQPELVNGTETTVLELEPEALAKTIILTNPKSSTYTLTDGNHSLTVTAPGFPWCAFWSPHAPFVCIEPWHSHTDFDKAEVPFEEREGTVLLGPGEVFETGYRITVV